MCREVMIQEIVDRLESASDADLESVYWMILMELGEG